MKFKILPITLLVLIGQSNFAQGDFEEAEIIVYNNGWELVGDLTIPNTEGACPAVLMLNKAAGDRHVVR